jgi:hypothetical protein
VSLAKSGNTDSTYIMTVHADGDCACNPQHLSDSTVALCDRTPSSSHGVLSYNYASIGMWLQALYSGRLFSVCDPFVSHGTYDSGSQPVVSLFPLTTSSTPTATTSPVGVGLVAMHVGRPIPSNASIPTGSADHASKATDVCGQARPFNGIVLDRWVLWYARVWL